MLWAYLEQLNKELQDPAIIKKKLMEWNKKLFKEIPLLAQLIQIFN